MAYNLVLRKALTACRGQGWSHDKGSEKLRACRWDDSAELADHSRQYMGAQWKAACITAGRDL